jgi:hypothetical protein
VATAIFFELNWRPAVPVGKTKSTRVRAEKPLKEYAGKRDFARTPGATWIGAAFDPQSAPNIEPGLCEVIH